MTDDELLRSAGFKIYTRATGVEPRWVRKGRIYTQDSALRIASAEWKQAKDKVGVTQKG